MYLILCVTSVTLFLSTFSINDTGLSHSHTINKSSFMTYYLPVRPSVCFLTFFSFHLSIYFSPPPSRPLFSLAHEPVVARATALTCPPMFPWARGPLGASQQASLPATSGTVGMERALVSALKVNEATAWHSVTLAPPPTTRPGMAKYSVGTKVQLNHTQI